MLTGIKRGKKKKKQQDDSSTAPSAAAAAAPMETNVAAAAALKDALLRGQQAPPPPRDANHNDDDERVVVTTASSVPALSTRREEDMTVTELAAYERRRRQQRHGAQEEDEARALLRSRKRRKRTTDSDEEVDAWVDRNHVNVNGDKQQDKVQKRWRARQLAAHDRQNALAQRSWWWMESSRFSSASLVSTTPDTTVSLALAPASRSWHPDVHGHPHFYLVPQHTATPGGAACDETVWNDVRRYQKALRQWVAATYNGKKGVVFAEVVLPSRGDSASAFYQARIHAMVVPRRLHQDAALIFQSALRELVLEHGTHQKRIQTLDKGKPLPHLVPSHFAYLYAEWDDRAGNVLILEERHRDVTVDWPLEVLGGRLGLDPLRMRRLKSETDEALRARVEAIQDTWKDFDWTLNDDNDDDDDHRKKRGVAAK